jgi:hypothetical protein
MKITIEVPDKIAAQLAKHGIDLEAVLTQQFPKILPGLVELKLAFDANAINEYQLKDLSFKLGESINANDK